MGSSGCKYLPGLQGHIGMILFGIKDGIVEPTCSLPAAHLGGTSAGRPTGTIKGSCTQAVSQYASLGAALSGLLVVNAPFSPFALARMPRTQMSSLEFSMLKRCLGLSFAFGFALGAPRRLVNDLGNWWASFWTGL